MTALQCYSVPKVPKMYHVLQTLSGEAAMLGEWLHCTVVKAGALELEIPGFSHSSCIYLSLGKLLKPSESQLSYLEIQVLIIP